MGQRKRNISILSSEEVVRSYDSISVSSTEREKAEVTERRLLRKLDFR